MHVYWKKLLFPDVKQSKYLPNIGEQEKNAFPVLLVEQLHIGM